MTIKKACKHAKTYKGIRYPQCDRDDGQPCDVCWIKWSAAEERRRRAVEAAEGQGL